MLPISELPPRPPLHFPGLSLGTPQLFSSKHALATKEKGLTLMRLSLVAKPRLAGARRGAVCPVHQKPTSHLVSGPMDYCVKTSRRPAVPPALGQAPTDTCSLGPPDTPCEVGPITIPLQRGGNQVSESSELVQSVSAASRWQSRELTPVLSRG